MRFPKGMMPNSWHKATMTMKDTKDCHEMSFYKFWIYPNCPIDSEPVSIYDCNDCDFGVKGDNKTGIVWCNHERWIKEEE